MSSPARLATLLSSSDSGLDDLSAAIAAAVTPDVTEADVHVRFDAAAAGLADAADAESVMRHLFGALGFHGNTTDYYAPENSLMDQVLQHRTGNPLSLAVVAIETARRIGVHLTPVGMPAHFLIGEGHTPSRWFDPFSGGPGLSAQDCEQLFQSVTPEGARFDPVMLLPIPNQSVVARMIANLRNAYVGRGDIGRLIRVLELRTALPDCTVGEKVELARMLGAMGREEQAAKWYLDLAAAEPQLAEKFRAVAARHLARLN